MKRIFASILLIFMFTLTACSPADAGMEFLSPLAWSARSATQEMCKYQFTRYLGTKSGTVLTTQDSYLQYTLKEGKSIEINQEGGVSEIDNIDCTLLISQFSVTYLDISAVPEPLKSKTETVQAWTVFDRYNMAAKYTFKHTNLVEASGDNLNYTMWVDYVGKKDEFLGKRSAKIVYGNQQTFSSKIKADTYYDSEAFYYLARTLGSLKLGGSQTFKLSLPYEELLNKNKTLKTRDVKQTTADKSQSIDVSADIYQLFYETEGQDVKIPCFNTKLALNEEKNGPSINMYYSTVPTLDDIFKNLAFRAKNVLVAFDYPVNIKTSSGFTLYTQDYKLVEYSNGGGL